MQLLFLLTGWAMLGYLYSCFFSSVVSEFVVQ